MRRRSEARALFSQIPHRTERLEHRRMRQGARGRGAQQRHNEHRDQQNARGWA
jgi:hypothetical protein